jgi:hypothetical protein
MTVPYYINEHQSDIRAIKPGWYGVENNGKLSSGPYLNQGKCLSGITHARSNFRASPWGARPIASSNVRASPWLRPSSVPRVGTSTSGRALALMRVAANGLTTLARPADTQSASKK